MIKHLEEKQNYIYNINVQTLYLQAWFTLKVEAATFIIGITHVRVFLKKFTYPLELQTTKILSLEPACMHLRVC